MVYGKGQREGGQFADAQRNNEVIGWWIYIYIYIYYFLQGLAQLNGTRPVAPVAQKKPRNLLTRWDVSSNPGKRGFSH